jgi:5'-AMP-activated protein kinase catalytic alpha subunit
MLCGYLPYEDAKTSNLYKKILSADYVLPKFLSPEAKDILGRIFVTDPEKRIDIEGLKKHAWYKLAQPENTNFDFHKSKLTVDQKLLDKMENQLGFTHESVDRAVLNNKHNHLSATYYLLKRKQEA